MSPLTFGQFLGVQLNEGFPLIWHIVLVEDRFGRAFGNALPRVNDNQFVLGKLIGSSGFGTVYRANMQSDASTVAVKFLRKPFWQNEDARLSFVREIGIASQIQHPGVICYLGYGKSPHGGPYVICEWIDGCSLRDFVIPAGVL
jgi:serine/threonine protein kinase